MSNSSKLYFNTVSSNYILFLASSSNKIASNKLAIAKSWSFINGTSNPI